MTRSLVAVLVGTFSLRFSTGLTGALLTYYLAELHRHGGTPVGPLELGVLQATFFASELILATPFGYLSDRLGHQRIMQVGPLLGAVAVALTWLTTNLVLIGGTRVLEGMSTAASVPSILGFIAMATSVDEDLRGKMSARFEGATIAGLGVGIVSAGLLYAGVHADLGPIRLAIDGLGRNTFLLNTALYLVSFAIYRFGVSEPAAATAHRAGRRGRIELGRYVGILRSSHIWLLAPTWIAINATLALYTGQTLFALVRNTRPEFAHQLLMGRFDPAQISVGLAISLVVFFAGLVFWGNRFRRYRRTTIILFGIGGGAAMVSMAFLINHSDGLPVALRVVELLVLGAGLFVLSGATPAALGLLADVSEAFPGDRGVIMGLYSVFLAVGQIGGSLLGGAAADLRGLDGIFGLTLVLLAVALVPLFRLRASEHMLASGRVELA